MDDIRRATELAYRSVSQWGLSSAVGPLNVGTLAAGAAEDAPILKDGGECHVPYSELHCNPPLCFCNGRCRRCFRGSGAAREALLLDAEAAANLHSTASWRLFVSQPADLYFNLLPAVTAGGLSQLVEREVKALLEGALAVASLTLEANRPLHDGLSGALQKEERLEKEALERWLQHVKAPQALSDFVLEGRLPDKAQVRLPPIVIVLLFCESWLLLGVLKGR